MTCSIAESSCRGRLHGQPPTPAGRSLVARAAVEALEGRVLLSTYTVTTTGDTGPGSLRQAILDANNHAGADTIAFAIGSGHQTIVPRSAYPQVTGPVVIDGTTQPGFAGTPIIELNGENAGLCTGLQVRGGNSTVRGLVVNRFAYSGIDLYSNNNRVAGNFVGTDVTGTQALGNVRRGIFMAPGSSGNVIGGTTAADRNLVSGNLMDGIWFYDSGSGTVIGNYVGTDVSGTRPLPNGMRGVFLTVSNNVRIGGAIPAERNVIAGNVMEGVHTRGANTIIQGNYIGLDATGTTAIPNGGDGIVLDYACTNALVGGDTAAAGNVIAANGGNGIAIVGTTRGARVSNNRIGLSATGADMGNALAGVRADAGAKGNTIASNTIAHNGRAGVVVAGGATQIAIRANVMAGNAGLGIDLGGDGMTPNDPGDGDGGPNARQNCPVLQSAGRDGAGTRIVGTLNSAASTTYVLDFYASDSAGGQGETYLGSTSAGTDGEGNATFSTSLPVSVAEGRFVVASATTPSSASVGGTSEFSGPVVVGATPPAGDSVVYLSDLPWISVSNGYGPAERDTSNGEQAAGDGRAITLNGVKYAKGLGVHANGELVFDLAGQYTAFQSDVGVDDEIGNRGTVTFQVWLDDVKVYDSGVMTGNSATRTIALDVSGKSQLRLVVTDAGDNFYYDHADWAGARLTGAADPPPVIDPPPVPDPPVYLSDLPWTSVTNGYGPVERDTSNGEQAAGDGRVITLNGVKYAKGLGAHGDSEIVYAIGGQYQTFRAAVGLDDEIGNRGTVTFQVWADGVKLFDSGVMTGGSATQLVEVSVAGASELRLVVTDAGDNFYYDHADWADARLLT